MKLHKLLGLVGAGALLLLAVSAWLAPANDDFSLNNPYWNGASDLNRARPVVINSLSNLPASPGGSTLILVPYVSFSPSELARLRDYVASGGNLVLADDYGYGNEVLAFLGMEARFSGQPILDPLVNYKNKYFPKIFPQQPGSLTGKFEALALNHATSLENVLPESILAQSSTFSFLDFNGNGDWDEDEPNGALPVISQHRLNAGQVILIADPSLFINSMAPLESNYEFIQNLTAASRLIIDQSHLPASELSQTKERLAKLRSFLTTPAGTLTIVILALAIALLPLWQKRRQEIDQTAG